MNLEHLNSWDDDLDDREYPNADGEDFDDEVYPCPECGAEVYEDASVCPECGAFVSPHTNLWAGRSCWWIALGLLGIAAVCWSLVAGF